MNKKILALCFMLLVGPVLAIESDKPVNLEQFFATSINDFSGVVNTDSAQEVDYVMSKIRLRLRGKVGLEVPFLAKLEIKPFIEFHFTKK